MVRVRLELGFCSVVSTISHSVTPASNAGSRHYSIGQVVRARISSPVSQLQETGVQKGVFGDRVVMVIKCARLS